MEARIVLVFADKDNEEHVVKFRGTRITPRTLATLDNAIQKQFTEGDWIRWELREFIQPMVE